MNSHWYAACLDEVVAFLDKFETQKTATVKIDSDLVAALTGLLGGANAIQAMGKHLEAGYVIATLLETPLGEDQ